MPHTTRFALLGAGLLALSLAACRNASGPEPASAPAPRDELAALAAQLQAVVDAPDRSPEDRALDAGRHPVELLGFYGIRPGMRVAELGAGGGYTSELLARSVGPTGRVYAQNSPFILERFAQGPWSARLAKPVMQNVLRLDRPFDDPFPADVRDLNAVLIVLLYHDVVWMKADRERMNRAVFAALAPGGVYGVIDHSAKPGRGLADVETLHRIDEVDVRREVESAGFVFAGEGEFLRNPADPRDWNASPRVAGAQRGTSDRFVFKFLKPDPNVP